MTIYEDGREKEKIKLYDLKTKEAMHALFIEKGFRKKGQDVIIEEKRVKIVEEEIKKMEQAKPMESIVTQLYAAILFITVAFVFLIQRSRRKPVRLPIRAVGGGSAVVRSV